MGKLSLVVMGKSSSDVMCKQSSAVISKLSRAQEYRENRKKFRKLTFDDGRTER